MLPLSEMIVRFLVAVVLGAIIGWERELIGKEAGIRTSMLVSGGAAIFALIGLALPLIMVRSGFSEANAGTNGAMAAIANIVVGIGFLGAGIIFKDKERVHGLTTAAVVWATAAIGVLSGIGLISFAVFVTVFLALVLFLLRRFTLKPSPKRKNR